MSRLHGGIRIPVHAEGVGEGPRPKRPQVFGFAVPLQCTDRSLLGGMRRGNFEAAEAGRSSEKQESVTWRREAYGGVGSDSQTSSRKAS